MEMLDLATHLQLDYNLNKLDAQEYSRRVKSNINLFLSPTIDMNEYLRIFICEQPHPAIVFAIQIICGTDKKGRAICENLLL